MLESSFVSVALILALAVAGGMIAKLFRQPIIVSYIIVGILAGPTAFNLVQNAEEIILFAKFGIAILLFLVGLKLDFHMIRSTGKVAAIGGLAQVIFTAVVGYVLALLFGFDAITSFYIAVALTFSSTIRFAIALPDRSGPGITRFAPDATAACARPHALAWNIGTTGRMVSLSRAPSESTVIAPKVCRNVERWLYTTPFGLPVVPLV